jgi:hypothetical protein
MGDIGLFKRRPGSWTAGHAHPRTHRTYDPPDSGWFDEVPTPNDLRLLLDVHWEVHVPGWPPYEMREVGRRAPRWLQPSTFVGKGRRVWSLRLRETHGLLAGVGVPCLVDPRDHTRLWFDWDAAYALHVPAWDRASGVARGIEERKGGIDAVVGKIVTPFRAPLDPRDAHHVDAAIAVEEARTRQVQAEGDLYLRAVNMGFLPPKPSEHQAVMDHLRWCLHTFAHGPAVPATVVSIAPSGRTLCRTPVYELHLDVADGPVPRRIVHHEVMNDAWAARLAAGTGITVSLDANDPHRLALDTPPT